MGATAPEESSMTPEAKKKLYQQLAQPFPEEAIERTDGRQTGKGYSTTGIKAQFIINRLNETLGIGGWRTHRTIAVKEIATNSGRKAYEAVCDLVLELGEWTDGAFVPFAEALADGGHVSVSEADARKGSFSNALKKAAAAFGAGWQAYAGTIDDDNVPADTSMQPEPVPQAPVHQQRPAVAQFPANPQRPVAVPRNRLSSKQLGALWVISRKQGYDQVEFRNRVKTQYGVQVEYLTKQQASELIGSMGNGGVTDHKYVEPDLREPGQEG
jgi:hypothetical protein